LGDGVQSWFCPVCGIANWSWKVEVMMFDAEKILQQVLGGGDDSGNPDSRRSGISTDTLKGAVIGGLGRLLLGLKGGRKIRGPALQMGGIAILGGLAYKGWQNWQAKLQGRKLSSATAGTRDLARHAEGTAFLPSQKAERSELSLTLLCAMIAAAKSDGHLDAAKQDRFFAKIDDGNLSTDETAYLRDQIRKPMDMGAIAKTVTTPERAAEIYAASLLAIDRDLSKETKYLTSLANRSRLDEALRASIETEIKAAMIPA
jgi:uncharacterized membrane protein YebE (DUF533 family)